MWAIGIDLPTISPTGVVRPDSTQSYFDSDTSSNSDSTYDTPWEDRDSGYDSDPFFALFLLTLIQGILNHWALIRRIIIRRVVFKGLVLGMLACFGYLPSWWDTILLEDLPFWWDAINLNLSQLINLIKWWLEHYR